MLASAALPMDLGLVSARQRKLDRPLVGRLRTDSVDLTLLQSLFPDITTATGKLNTDVALSGTWANPQLRGQIRLNNGNLDMANLGVHYDRVNADLALGGDTLFVRKLGAISGLPGDSVSVVGHVAFSDLANPSFDLRLAANNFTAIDKPRNAFLVVTTTRPVALTGSTSAALVRGGVRIDRGRVYVRALTQKRAIDVTDNFDVVDTSVIRMDALLPSAPASSCRTSRWTMSSLILATMCGCDRPKRTSSLVVRYALPGQSVATAVLHASHSPIHSPCNAALTN